MENEVIAPRIRCVRVDELCQREDRFDLPVIHPEPMTPVAMATRVDVGYCTILTREATVTEYPEVMLRGGDVYGIIIYWEKAAAPRPFYAAPFYTSARLHCSSSVPDGGNDLSW